MVDSKPKTILEKVRQTVAFDPSGKKHGYIFFAMLMLKLFAFWSVWRWYLLRLTTSGDEFYGILSILAVLGICFYAKPHNTLVKSIYFSVASIIFYVVGYSYFPPLLRSIIAVTGLTFFLSGWRFGKLFHFGIWSLFLLGLPIIASLQFYLGFPLRVIVGEAAVFFLKLNGLDVFREGVGLHFGEQIIWIDAPCSGIKMLWAGFFLTALLVTLFRFSLMKIMLAFSASLAIILLGNIFRATSLFIWKPGL